MHCSCAKGAKDFRSGQGYDLMVFFDEGVDIHHIFPQEWCAVSRSIDVKVYDTIVNKTPLIYRTNRIIGGVAPSKYLAKLEPGRRMPMARSRTANQLDCAGRLSCTSHCISPAHLRDDDFESFMKERRKAAAGHSLPRHWATGRAIMAATSRERVSKRSVTKIDHDESELSSRRRDAMAKAPTTKTVETLKHDEATRKNIPTAEYQSVLAKEQQTPEADPLPAQHRPRPPARLARQGRAGLERPRRPRPAALHPGEGPPQGADRRPAARRRRKASTTPGSSRPTSSPTSTASPRARTRPSSTPTTRTGPTA